MNRVDPNIPLLESVAHALGTIKDRFVFVGGCATGLMVTDTAAAPVRTTKDVDVIVEAISLSDYQSLERELEEAGFKHDISRDAPMAGRNSLRRCKKLRQGYEPSSWRKFGNLLKNTAFLEAVPGHLLGNETSQARASLILDRLRKIAGL